jgi:hypothetical protein
MLFGYRFNAIFKGKLGIYQLFVHVFKPLCLRGGPVWVGLGSVWSALVTPSLLIMMLSIMGIVVRLLSGVEE